MTEIEELRKWAAEKVMGWGPPVEEYNGRRVPKYLQNYANSEQPVDDWHPDDPNTGQIWMVNGKMVDAGYELRLYAPVGKSHEYEAEYQDGYARRAPNPCLAILRAAKAAWRDDDE